MDIFVQTPCIFPVAVLCFKQETPVFRGVFPISPHFMDDLIFFMDYLIYFAF